MARTLGSEKMTIKYNLGKKVQHLIESEHKYQTIILIIKKRLKHTSRTAAIKRYNIHDLSGS